MKKLIFIFLSVLLLTSCTSSQKELNLTNINNNLISLNYNNELMFPNVNTVSKEIIEMKYGVSLEYFDDYSIVMPTMATTASMYAIFLPNKDHLEEAEEVSDTILDKYIGSWTTIIYNANEASLASNMLKTKYNGYIIYIISNDNDQVLGSIKNSN